METSRRHFLMGSGSLLMPKLPQHLLAQMEILTRNPNDVLGMVLDCMFNVKHCSFCYRSATGKATLVDAQEYLRERNGGLIKTTLRLRNVDLKVREKFGKDKEIALKLANFIREIDPDQDKKLNEAMTNSMMQTVSEDHALEYMLQTAVRWIDNFTVEYFSQIKDGALRQDLIDFAKREPHIIDSYFEPTSPAAYREIFMRAIHGMQPPLLSSGALNPETSVAESVSQTEQSSANVLRNLTNLNGNESPMGVKQDRDQVALPDHPALPADQANAMTTLDHK